MSEQNDDKFKYSYSAPTEEMRREIEGIRREYGGKDGYSDEYIKLRSLDSKVKNIPKAVALTVGIIGILLFGLGMSIVLVWLQVAVGVVLSVVGVAIMIVVYPLYTMLLKQLKQKHSTEILQLSEKLLSKNNMK